MRAVFVAVDNHALYVLGRAEGAAGKGEAQAHRVVARYCGARCLVGRHGGEHGRALDLGVYDGDAVRDVDLQ